MKNVLVLLSGGIDSMALAEYALEQGKLEVCMFIDWGHPSSTQEVNACLRWCNINDVPLINRVVELDSTAMRIPSGKSGPRVTPARNAAFLSVAANYASSHEISEVWYGATKKDRDEYYDCREEWIRKLNLVLYHDSVWVRAPFVTWSKQEVLDIGIGLGLDPEMTFSCYAPLKNGEPCGSCNSCCERKAVLANSQV